MEDITITLDEKTALWVHLEAAKRDMSVAVFLRELLRDAVPRDGDYGTKARYIGRSGNEDEWCPREELHDRPWLTPASETSMETGEATTGLFHFSGFGSGLSLFSVLGVF